MPLFCVKYRDKESRSKVVGAAGMVSEIKSGRSEGGMEEEDDDDDGNGFGTYEERLPEVFIPT